MPDFLTVADVLLLHSDQLDRYGGGHGIRDIDLLDSAIAQAQTSFGGEYLHEFPFEMAASYMFHLVQNHPFIDGNKRTGAIAALVFLDLNGIEFDARQGSLYDITISVATGNADKDAIVEYLQANAQ